MLVHPTVRTAKYQGNFSATQRIDRGEHLYGESMFMLLFPTGEKASVQTESQIQALLAERYNG
jgi:hypothetical protein